MTREQFLRNLETPTSPVDVVLDTDAFNEVDDRYAIAYLLRSKEKLNEKAIYAAPYLHDRVENVRLPKDNGYYGEELPDKKMGYVYYLYRDPLMKDLFDKLTIK